MKLQIFIILGIFFLIVGVGLFFSQSSKGNFINTSKHLPNELLTYLPGEVSAIKYYPEAIDAKRVKVNTALLKDPKIDVIVLNFPDNVSYSVKKEIYITCKDDPMYRGNGKCSEGMFRWQGNILQNNENVADVLFIGDDVSYTMSVSVIPGANKYFYEIETRNPETGPILLIKDLSKYPKDNGSDMVDFKHSNK